MMPASVLVIASSDAASRNRPRRPLATASAIVFRAVEVVEHRTHVAEKCTANLGQLRAMSRLAAEQARTQFLLNVADVLRNDGLIGVQP